jgi:hypothetical protein
MHTSHMQTSRPLHLQHRMHKHTHSTHVCKAQHTRVRTHTRRTTSACTSPCPCIRMHSISTRDRQAHSSSACGSRYVRQGGPHLADGGLQLVQILHTTRGRVARLRCGTARDKHGAGLRATQTPALCCALPTLSVAKQQETAAVHHIPLHRLEQWQGLGTLRLLSAVRQPTRDRQKGTNARQEDAEHVAPSSTNAR